MQQAPKECVKEVIKVYGKFEGVSKNFQGVLGKFYGCLREISRLFQECFTGDSSLFSRVVVHIFFKIWRLKKLTFQRKIGGSLEKNKKYLGGKCKLLAHKYRSYYTSPMLMVLGKVNLTLTICSSLIISSRMFVIVKIKSKFGGFA